MQANEASRSCGGHAPCVDGLLMLTIEWFSPSCVCRPLPSALLPCFRRSVPFCCVLICSCPAEQPTIRGRFRWKSAAVLVSESNEGAGSGFRGRAVERWHGPRYLQASSARLPRYPKGAYSLRGAWSRPVCLPVVFSPASRGSAPQQCRDWYAGGCMPSRPLWCIGWAAVPFLQGAFLRSGGCEEWYRWGVSSPPLPFSPLYSVA